jgi:hypothetical protein
MKSIRLALGSFLFVMLFASASVAQQRTFVSGLGSDGNPCNDGILILGASAVAVDQVRLEGNSFGLFALDGANVTVRNSVASQNATGFYAISNGAAAVELDIEACVVSHNSGSGIVSASQSTGISTVRVSNSTVTSNGLAGLFNVGSPALMLSRGNNTVEGNHTNTHGVIGSYTAK